MPLSPELEFHPLVLVTHRDSKPQMKLHLPAAALRAGSSPTQVGSCDNGCSGARREGSCVCPGASRRLCAPRP